MRYKMHGAKAVWDSTGRIRLDSRKCCPGRDETTGPNWTGVRKPYSHLRPSGRNRASRSRSDAKGTKKKTSGQPPTRRTHTVLILGPVQTHVSKIARPPQERIL